MKAVRRIIITLVVVFGSFWLINTPAYAEEYNGYEDTVWAFFENIGIFNRKQYYCRLFKDTYIHTHVIKEISAVTYHQKGIETSFNFYKPVSFDGASTPRYNAARGYNSERWATEKVLEYTKGEGSYVPGFRFDSSLYCGTTLKDEKDGYYQLAACQNFYKYQVRVCDGTTCVKKINVFIPTGTPYLKLMYGGNDKKGAYFR